MWALKRPGTGPTKAPTEEIRPYLKSPHQCPCATQDPDLRFARNHSLPRVLSFLSTRRLALQLHPSRPGGCFAQLRGPHLQPLAAEETPSSHSPQASLSAPQRVEEEEEEEVEKEKRRRWRGGGEAQPPGLGQRIWPFRDLFGVFSHHVVFTEEEQGAVDREAVLADGDWVVEGHGPRSLRHRLLVHPLRSGLPALPAAPGSSAARGAHDHPGGRP